MFKKIFTLFTATALTLGAGAVVPENVFSFGTFIKAEAAAKTVQFEDGYTLDIDTSKWEKIEHTDFPLECDYEYKSDDAAETLTRITIQASAGQSAADEIAWRKEFYEDWGDSVTVGKDTLNGYAAETLSFTQTCYYGTPTVESTSFTNILIINKDFTNYTIMYTMESGSSDKMQAEIDKVLSTFTINKAVHVHEYIGFLVAPTYTSEGYTLYSCECGDSYKDEITPKLTRLDISKATVSGISNKYYTGKAIKQSPTLKLGTRTLKAGTDYTVTYKNNKAVGTATATFTGKGDFTGKVSKTFKICPKKTAIKKVTSPKTKQLKVTYSKVSGVTGYQVTYSTSSKFTKKTTKSVNVSGTSKTISKLTKGKTYYVKVRTYKTVSGTKYYSGYTAVKKIKVK